MCGIPKKDKMTFYKDGDDTLGNMIKRICKKAELNCEECSLPMHKHIRLYYHKDGYVEI